MYGGENKIKNTKPAPPAQDDSALGKSSASPDVKAAGLIKGFLGYITQQYNEKVHGKYDDSATVPTSAGLKTPIDLEREKAEAARRSPEQKAKDDASVALMGRLSKEDIAVKEAAMKLLGNIPGYEHARNQIPTTKQSQGLGF